MRKQADRRSQRSPDPHPAEFRQADYFREELLAQLTLLDAQASVFHAALAKHSLSGADRQVNRVQEHLRECNKKRQALIGMISALAVRFSLDEADHLALAVG